MLPTSDTSRTKLEAETAQNAAIVKAFNPNAYKARNALGHPVIMAPATVRPAPEGLTGMVGHAQGQGHAFTAEAWAQAARVMLAWALPEASEAQAFTAYVAACEDESLSAHGPTMWRNHGRPTGPI